MHTLSTDMSVHESVKHLGMAHIYCEQFAIAHHNVYTLNDKKKNPLKGHAAIGKLLGLHVTDLIAVNHLARYTLVATYDNYLDRFSGLRGTNFVEAIAMYMKDNNSFNHIGYTDELKKRGFTEDVQLKNYHF